ncbi:MAG: hypothetical protein V1872_00425 [bacterium]
MRSEGAPHKIKGKNNASVKYEALFQSAGWWGNHYPGFHPGLV